MKNQASLLLPATLSHIKALSSDEMMPSCQNCRGGMNRESKRHSYKYTAYIHEGKATGVYGRDSELILECSTAIPCISRGHPKNNKTGNVPIKQ